MENQQPSTWGDRALKALKVYVERGELSLQLLLEDRIEEADAILDKRRAAFYNFRALDHLARKEGYAIEAEIRLKKLVDVARAQDQLLMGKLQVLLTDQKEQLGQIKRAMAALKHYRSTRVEEKSLIESV
jgi:hypothetical protein